MENVVKAKTGKLLAKVRANKILALAKHWLLAKSNWFTIPAFGDF